MKLEKNYLSYLQEFLTNDHELKLFQGLFKQPFLDGEWVILEDTLSHERETMLTLHYKGENELEERLCCKGKNYSFSLNRKENEPFYLNHLLLGNPKEKKFYFSMRHEMMDSYGNDKECMTLWVKEAQKGKKHLFIIEEDKILWRLEEQYEHTSIPTSFYSFKQLGADTFDTNLKTREDLEQMHQELLLFETMYPTITSYVSDCFPLFNTFINYCYKTLFKEDEKVILKKELNLQRKTFPFK